MILRRVQRREVVVVILNLRALVNREAHPRENVDQLVPDLRHRMEAPDLSVRGRQRDVDLLALVAGLKLLLLRLLIERIEVIDCQLFSSLTFLPKSAFCAGSISFIYLMSWPILPDFSRNDFLVS